MTRTIWCEFAWLGGDRPQRAVRLQIDGGRFVTVEVDATVDGAERRLGLTFPGFANGHSHAFHRALRGRTHTGGGDFWSWREQMYRLAARLDPTAYFRLARATFSEMVAAGYTTVGEFHYLHHGPAGRRYSDPNEMGRAVIAAARDAGIRITLLDTCYLHGGFDRPLDAVQMRFGDGTVDAWAERVSELGATDGVRVGAAVHSVRACTPDEIAAVVAAAPDGPLHAHVSEQPAENDGCVATYGATPTQVLASSGAITPRFTAVHAIHLTEHDLTLLGGASASACICPSTERDLADGIAPASALAAAGSNLCVGSDSNSMIDPLEEARSLEYGERVVTNRRGHFDPIALLGAATDHRPLGWDDAGRIAVGARADLVTVGLESVRLAGAEVDSMLATVLHAGHPSDVTAVTVDGIDRVSDGVYGAGDVAAEYAALLPRLFA